MDQAEQRLSIARPAATRILAMLLASTAFSEIAVAQQVRQGLASEEIVVTAERRGQNIQSVPSSITAFDAKTIKDLRIEQIEDLTKVTPGLSLRSTGVSADPLLTVRGLGMNNGETNQNPAVTAYINDVALPSHAFLGFQIFDMDRIEVLKGPQGTLYGRNTTGGAINFITKRPTQDFQASGRVDVGNYKSVEIEGAVGGGVTDKLAVRLAVSSLQRSGWQALNLGAVHGDVDSRNGDIDRKAIRGSALWTPSDRFDALIVADYGRNESETLAYKHAGNLLLTSRTACSYPTTGVPDDTTCGSYSIPRASPGGAVLGATRIFQDLNRDPREAWGSFIFGNQNDARTAGVNATLNMTLDRAKVTSVTGYRSLSRDIGGDDGSPAILSDVLRHQRLKLFSEEIRLASDASWGRFNWIVGGYYSRDSNHDQAIFNQQDQFAYSALFDSRYVQKTWSGAGFAQGGVAVTDQLNLTIGLRWTHESRKFDYDGTVVGSGAYPVPVRGYRSNIATNQTTGKVGAEYKFAPEQLVYANVSRGFKGGGYPATIAFSLNDIQPFAPETIWAYETGVKSTLIKNVLRANAALYYYDWKNFQATTQVNRGGVPVTVLTTAGDAKITGAEADITWFVTPELSFRTGVNFMRTEVINGRYEGMVTPNAPRLMLNGVVRYEPDVSGSLRPYFQVDASYNSKTQTALPNTVPNLEPSLTLVNARVGFKYGANLDIAAWVRNLADKTYRTQVLGPGSASLPARFIYGDPRMVGVSVSYTY